MAGGVKYGYHVNPSKSCLIIKHPSSMKRAMEIFGESGIEIKNNGKERNVNDFTSIIWLKNGPK